MNPRIALRKLAGRAVLVSTLMAAAVGLSVAPAHAQPSAPTVVLVHGAFADSSGWRDVAQDLRSRGLAVQTFDNPLRSPAYDSEQLEKKLATID